MHEITIDMSSPACPESPQKLLPKNAEDALDVTDLAKVIKQEADESTADTQLSYQQQSAECLPTLVVPLHFVEADYLEEVLDHLRKREEKLLTKASTKAHAIKPELRAKMVDWIIEVTQKAECTLQTLFLAVGIIDDFLKNAKLAYKAADMHKIGVVAMLLASKFEDVTGMDVEFMYEQVVHKKEEKSSIMAKVLSFIPRIRKLS